MFEKNTNTGLFERSIILVIYETIDEAVETYTKNLLLSHCLRKMAYFKSFHKDIISLGYEALSDIYY